ncbi:MAG: hypothetical protein H6619_03535 [Deltaproteobacteria bacterium]|nr:hypothetical protein [Deltaproteobacteria bacterium]
MLEQERDTEELVQGVGTPPAGCHTAEAGTSIDPTYLELQQPDIHWSNVRSKVEIPEFPNESHHISISDLQKAFFLLNIRRIGPSVQLEELTPSESASEISTARLIEIYDEVNKRVPEFSRKHVRVCLPHDVTSAEIDRARADAIELKKQARQAIVEACTALIAVSKERDDPIMPRPNVYRVLGQLYFNEQLGGLNGTVFRAAVNYMWSTAQNTTKAERPNLPWEGTLGHVQKALTSGVTEQSWATVQEAQGEPVPTSELLEQVPSSVSAPQHVLNANLQFLESIRAIECFTYHSVTRTLQSGQRVGSETKRSVDTYIDPTKDVVRVAWIENRCIETLGALLPFDKPIKIADVVDLPQVSIIDAKGEIHVLEASTVSGTRSSITDAAKKLEQAGHVKMERLSGNGRTDWYVSLTESGREIASMYYSTDFGEALPAKCVAALMHHHKIYTKATPIAA